MTLDAASYRGAQTSLQPARLPVSVCLGWGLGTLGVAALFNAVNVLLLRYLVDFVGVSAALAGTLIGASKIYDAFIDPLIGGVSDRTRSRFGRRRPFVLAGGLLLALSALLLFNVPAGLSADGRVAAIAIALIVYATAYATFSVPYMAMPAEMAVDPHERSRLISYRVYAVAVASLIATFLGPVLITRFGGGQSGHTAMSVFVAVIAALATVVCFRATRDAPMFESAPPPRLSARRKLALALENRPFLLLLLVKLLQLGALSVTQAAMPFLFRRVLGLSDAQLGLYFLVFYGAMILSQPLWIWVARRRGKRDAYLAATFAYALLYVSWYFVTTGEPLAFVYARAFTIGLLAGGVLLFGQSLLPDTMEYDFRRTGLRREGMLSAVYTIVEKLAFAVGAALTGLVLGRAGYIQGAGPASVTQPQTAIDAIFMLASIVPMALLLLSCVALRFYDLSEVRLAEVRRAH
jgi:glycoside/pentoside/hexuronide:cation symporter, GPH family